MKLLLSVIFCFLLSIILCFLLLTGCSGDNTGNLDIPKGSNRVINQQQTTATQQQRIDEEKKRQQEEDDEIQASIDAMLMSVATQ